MVDRWFASDNNAAAHPAVMDALVRANTGHAIGYGDDPVTNKAEATVAAVFGWSRGTLRTQRHRGKRLRTWLLCRRW
ncbi:hypothetical protein MASR2M48_04970 [Spirochaetota bacterium]